MALNNSCDPCREQGKQMKGENWCPTCEEVLCSGCSSHHKTLKATRNHELVDIKIATSLPPDFSIQQFCEKHQNILVEYYCTDQDEICCRACVAESHRQCEKVVALDIACENAKMLFLDNTSKETSIKIDTLQALEKELTVNQRIIEDDSSKIESMISQAKERIIDKINELQLCLVKELHVTKDIIKDHIEKNSRKILEIKKKSEIEMQQIQFVDKHGSDRQAFILAHKLKPSFRETVQSVTELTTKGKRYNLSCNYDQTVILSLGAILHSETQFSISSNPINLQQPKFKSEGPVPINSFEISYQFDTTGTNILGMIATDDNKLLLCYYSSKNGVLVYTQEGRYIQTITMASRPLDIAHIHGTDRFVVSLPEIRSIQFLHHDMIPGKTVKLKFRNKNDCVAATSKHIYTGDAEKILVLDTDGNMQKQINLTARYMYAVESGKCYVTTLNKCRLVGVDGKIEKFITNIFGDGRKIVVDLVGFVYVVDCSRGIIYRFKEDLTPDIKIGNVLFKDTWAICLNKDCSKLFVANNKGRSIIVLNCK